ncbi:MAG TPA: winged helix-turn-helix domain-containing protein [Ktedonobacterales bacterium]|nr:winged helix-turn-helix domain-containing protein [Ktedonobacterales bacterium]
MARHIHLQRHLNADDLERRYWGAKEPNERSWWQILWLLSQGHTAVAVSAVTGYSAYWIGQIARCYNTQDPAGMYNRRHTTSHRTPPIVPSALQEELRQMLAEAAARHEHWTGGDAAAWISARLGLPVCYRVGWSYLVRAKQSLQVPRPRHALADAE